jgi:hypothetical protein
VTKINDELETSKVELDALLAELKVIADAIPNLPSDTTPVGRDENDNVEVRRWGTPREFSFPVRDHIDLGEAAKGVDFKNGVKLSGARFVVMKGQIARLHRAWPSSCWTCTPCSTATPSATCPIWSTRTACTAPASCPSSPRISSIPASKGKGKTKARCASSPHPDLRSAAHQHGP